MTTELATAEQPAVIAAIQAALSDPFDPKEIKWKAQAVRNNRALAVGYVDARVVEDRLDHVVGVAGWSTSFQQIGPTSFECRLSLKLGGEWVTKADVGSTSEQPDEGDRVKAAYSDALKRAAIQFGIGRYLYRLPQQWVDYDPVKKQLTQVPTLPAFAMPRGRGQHAPQQQRPAPAKATADPVLPATGQELHRRLQEYDAKLAGQKLCVRGALLAHIVQAGVKAGYSANVADWAGPAIPFAVEAVKEFEQNARQPKAIEQPKPAEPTVTELRDMIFAEIRRTGRDPLGGWAMAMQWLCSRYPTEAIKYTTKTRAIDIELPRLKELLANLKTHPSAQGAA